MKIKVWTKQSNHFIQQAGQVLRQRGHSKIQADKFQNGQVDGELIIFDDLSNAQFCALEDTVVHMGLHYDGCQEEQQQESATQSDQFAGIFVATIEAKGRTITQRQNTQEEAPPFKPSACQEEVFDVLRQTQTNFGDLLRQVCLIAGFTQGKLSREAKAEVQRLIEAGKLQPDDPIGSLEQPTIARVMAGRQPTTYYQVYLWLAVLGKHLNS